MVSIPWALSRDIRFESPGYEIVFVREFLPPNVGLPGANPNLLGIECGYRKNKKKSASKDTVYHVSSDGQSATYIWKKFSMPLGTKHKK